MKLKKYFVKFKKILTIICFVILFIFKHSIYASEHLPKYNLDEQLKQNIKENKKNVFQNILSEIEQTWNDFSQKNNEIDSLLSNELKPLILKLNLPIDTTENIIKQINLIQTEDCNNPLYFVKYISEFCPSSKYFLNEKDDLNKLFKENLVNILKKIREYEHEKVSIYKQIEDFINFLSQNYDNISDEINKVKELFSSDAKLFFKNWLDLFNKFVIKMEKLNNKVNEPELSCIHNIYLGISATGENVANYLYDKEILLEDMASNIGDSEPCYNNKIYSSTIMINKHIKNPPQDLMGIYFDAGERDGQNDKYTVEELLLQGNGASNIYIFWRCDEKKEHKLTWDDIKGNDEVIVELQEIADYLKNPTKYEELHVNFPKGVLLYGPPGTGKTTLARILAKEAGVNFIYKSGSEFVERFVGVGAQRIRELFSLAKKKSPTIIFIDEIDALAVKRVQDSSDGGGMEFECTLNQLLAELDGFNSNTNIIFIGATNRKDKLDDAILRPGRLDRHIFVGLPDLNGRKELLTIFFKNKPIKSDVDLYEIAEKTYDMSGAQLKAIANEASILAIRAKDEKITTDHINEAIDKLLSGPTKKNTTFSKEETKRIAYHEAGHILANFYYDQRLYDKHLKPRNNNTNCHISFKTENEKIITKDDYLNKITSLISGHAAEEIMFDNINSNKAKGDIETIQKILKDMVNNDKIMFLFPSNPNDPYLATNTILQNCMFQAKDNINRNKKLLTQIADYLISNKYISKDKLMEFKTEFKKNLDAPIKNVTLSLKESENKSFLLYGVFGIILVFMAVVGFAFIKNKFKKNKKLVALC